MKMKYEVLEFKSLDINESRFIKGKASVANVKDLKGDVVTLEALKEVNLYWNNKNKDKDSKVKMPLMILEHKLGLPAGLWLQMSLAENELIIEGEINPLLKGGKKCLDMLDKNMIKGLSIGYVVKESYIENKSRILTSIHVVEVSLVSRPVNVNAVICNE